MADEPKPDNFTHGVRFGCGALLGAGLGLYMGFELLEEPVLFAAWMIGAVVVFGLASMILGNHFWQDHW